MEKKILKREWQTQCGESFAELHPLLQRIYAARQVKSKKELDRSLVNLFSYESLIDINKAAQLLGEAIRQQKKILIVGDFDADGATSTAIAMRGLRSLGAEHVCYLVPNRFSYGYGLTPELVAAAKPINPDVIITVDNGIVNHAGVLAAKSWGKCVIITDHHLPGSTLPSADAIVNPNQPADPFPSKNLAGCGVIFYVLLAVRRYLSEQHWFTDLRPAPNMARFLDLVALGTVADLVPLDTNNRILIYHGLQRINQHQCVPGILALLKIAGRQAKRVVASDLGFAVGARLNAAGRLDDMSLGIECLLCDDLEKTKIMAKQLDQLNDERKSIEQDMQTQAVTALTTLHSKLACDLPRGLCLFDESWHQGVIGILASRIKDRYHRPVIVFAPGQDNELKGSARSIAGLHIRDTLALIHANHPKLINKFGGHAMAAGLTIARDLLKNFREVFAEVVAKQISEAELQQYLWTDGELTDQDFNLEIAKLVREGGPWGQAFPEPLFDNTFHILDQRLVGGKHLKMRLAKEKKILDAIAFFVDLEKWPNYHAKKVRLVYKLDINEFRSREEVQLIVEHLEASN